MNGTCPQSCVFFNKIIVNSIEDASGIFVGTNQAIGWSSYSKSNQGFGSLRDSHLSNTVNVVYDSDIIDFSLNHGTTVSQSGSLTQQAAVAFESVNVNSLNNASALGIGGNKQDAWSNSRKNNYGSGKHYGSNRIRQVANVVVDTDVIDTTAHTANQIYDISESGSTVQDIGIVSGKEPDAEL